MAINEAAERLLESGWIEVTDDPRDRTRHFTRYVAGSTGPDHVTLEPRGATWNTLLPNREWVRKASARYDSDIWSNFIESACR